LSPRYRKVYPPGGESGEDMPEEDGGHATAPGAALQEDKGSEGRLKKEIKALRRELHDSLSQLENARGDAAAGRSANDKYLRLAAEMENLRKRHRQEQAERLQYANSELIAKLLPLLDNFHRALDHVTDEADEQWVSGLQMIVKQFEDILESEGVQPIEAVGKQFDPAMHQAVASETTDEYPEGTVTSELQRGYQIHDRVLRPTLVKVAQNS
jgi:molecular chaperone GrpE